MPPLTRENEVIRAVNVSASEVGALLGPHPYATPQGIFDRLRAGGGVERIETEAMRIGTALEPVIRGLAARDLGVTLHANSRTYIHPRIHLCATPDATIRHSRKAPTLNDVLAGRALVELKASGSRWRWANGLPPDVVWQVRAQMACHRRIDRVFVYVLIGTELRRFVVERHVGEERRMTQAVARFWRDHIETGIRPEVTPPEEVKVTLKGKRAG